MKKLKTILLTSFDSPAVIVPDKQPDIINVTAGIVFHDTIEDFIIDYSPFKPGEKLTGKVKNLNCEQCEGDMDYSTVFHLPSEPNTRCPNCVKPIQLSSNIEEWQLMKWFQWVNKYSRGRDSTRAEFEHDWFDSWSPIKSSDNPYVFIVKQEVTN